MALNVSVMDKVYNRNGCLLCASSCACATPLDGSITISLLLGCDLVGRWVGECGGGELNSISTSGLRVISILGCLLNISSKALAIFDLIIIVMNNLLEMSHFICPSSFNFSK